MSSKSGNDGSYSLTVTFDIGTDKNIDAIEVQNRVAIAQSQLPADVIRNGITVRKSTTDFLEVISLTSPERRYDAVFLSNYALLNLYDALGRVPGVGQVRIFGARDYSMRIWLNPERMARLGVTASDIANVIREQNVVAPAGGLGLPPVPAGAADAVHGVRQGPSGRRRRIREHRHPGSRERPGGAPQGRRPRRARRRRLLDQRRRTTTFPPR